MAYVDDRDAYLVAQPLDVIEDFGFARSVERSERLIEQQHLRLRQQRAADRDALLLAARKRAGTAFEQVADPEQFDRRVKADHLILVPVEKVSIEQVVPHREVRQEPPFLEHITDASCMRR